ncbi:MAG: DUF6228 family protein [Pseudomonadales bacterium]
MTDSTSLRTQYGGVLSFSIRSRTTRESKFEISCAQSGFSGKRIVSSYVVGTPDSLFKDMAANWKGWPGEKTWHDLERVAVLACSMDSTGHAWLKVTLTDHDKEARLETKLMFEAGELDALSTKVSKLFSHRDA